MSVLTVERIGTEAGSSRAASPDVMPGGLALSAALHVAAVLLLVLGLPNLFPPPPPQEELIAVDLVTIAPDTKATHPNPFRPMREAKPIPALAPPAPKPKPEPLPQPAAAEPPSSSAPPPLPPLPKPAKPEAKAPPPPPPKPVEAKAPPPPPEPKPKPERHEVREPPRHEERKPDNKAFAQMLDKLEEHQHQQRPQPAAFDALLKNLTQQQTAEAQDAPPKLHQMVAAAAPSSQPKAPLGNQITASLIDQITQQIERCWDVPAGARDAKDLVVEIKAVVNPDGTVNQATIVDNGQYGSNSFYRAAVDSARRAVLNPQCTGPGSPLPLPRDKYEEWHDLDLVFHLKDIQ